jgi:glycosyltransferase involved in cell wall biosynthesis
MIKLHNACDCFVMPSYGEAFCRPAAEALVLGKTPIVNKNTGMSDFINDSNGFLIRSGKIPVLLNHKPLSDEYDFYSSNQSWYKIDVYDLVEKLRYVYKNRDSEDLKTKSQNGQSSIDNFSYQSIGSKLCI